MVNTNDNEAQKEGQSDRNEHLYSVGHRIRRSERTKKEKGDGITESRKHSMSTIVIVESTK